MLPEAPSPPRLGKQFAVHGARSFQDTAPPGRGERRVGAAPFGLGAQAWVPGCTPRPATPRSESRRGPEPPLPGSAFLDCTDPRQRDRPATRPRPLPLGGSGSGPGSPRVFCRSPGDRVRRPPFAPLGEACGVRHSVVKVWLNVLCTGTAPSTSLRVRARRHLPRGRWEEPLRGGGGAATPMARGHPPPHPRGLQRGLDPARTAAPSGPPLAALSTALRC